MILMYLAIAWADAFMLLECLVGSTYLKDCCLWVISRNQCTAYHDQPNTKNWRKYIRANIFTLKRMEVIFMKIDMSRLGHHIKTHSQKMNFSWLVITIIWNVQLIMIMEVSCILKHDWDDYHIHLRGCGRMAGRYHLLFPHLPRLFH